jgi:hypothetical protein
MDDSYDSTEYYSPISSPTKVEFRIRELQCVNAEITAELLLAQSVNTFYHAKTTGKCKTKRKIKSHTA